METWYLAPMLNDLRTSFSLCFQDKVLAFNKKGENVNIQPSTLETVAMTFETKSGIFDRNQKKFKVQL